MGERGKQKNERVDAWLTTKRKKLDCLSVIEPCAELAVAYTKIVTISTNDILASNGFRDSVGARWPFLSDTERKVQQDLDIQEYTDSLHNPMIPHTLVLEPDLVIYKIYNGYWFWGRPSSEELRLDLRTVTSKNRLDWDLSTPGIRESWEGERKLHYPYRER